MRHFLAARFTSPEQESFDNVLSALLADPTVVVQWSLDERKEGTGNPSGMIYFLAETLAEDRLADLAAYWHLSPQEHVRAAPDNNAPFRHLQNRKSFTDHRVRQPEVTEDMEVYLLVGGKGDPGPDFNKAAAVLLKEPSVRLTWWSDHTNQPQSGLSGMFTVAAADRAEVDAVAQKLPGWNVVKQQRAPKPLA